jgi:hypothetical protein
MRERTVESHDEPAILVTDLIQPLPFTPCGAMWRLDFCINPTELVSDEVFTMSEANLSFE